MQIILRQHHHGVKPEVGTFIKSGLVSPETRAHLWRPSRGFGGFFAYLLQNRVIAFGEQFGDIRLTGISTLTTFNSSKLIKIVDCISISY